MENQMGRKMEHATASEVEYTGLEQSPSLQDG